MSGAAEAAFRKWYRTQSVAAVLCTGFLVVEKPVAMGLAAELGVLALAAFTGACGWRLQIFPTAAANLGSCPKAAINITDTCNYGITTPNMADLEN